MKTNNMGKAYTTSIESVGEAPEGSSAGAINNGSGSLNNTVMLGNCPSITKTTDSYPGVDCPDAEFQYMGASPGKSGRDGGYFEDVKITKAVR